MKKIIFCMLLLFFGCSTFQTKQKIYSPHLAYEGNFIMLGNPAFAFYIGKQITKVDLDQIEEKLKNSLEIPLTKNNFVQAANRFVKVKDETNYDAVWVRDSVWVYFSLLERGEKKKAKKVILALWDYYASRDQVVRFKNIINNPSLAFIGGMNVPHIRFNGQDSEFKDVMKDGKPEEWNHRQNDAHGLFLLAIIQGYEKGLISKNDFTPHRKSVLNLFVPYMMAIKYWDYPDAGAWEEINKINTSSVAMVVKALENSDKLVQFKLVNWDPPLKDKLINEGYKRIKKNLNLGGESPDHDSSSPEYRREDAALFNLFLPFPLKRLTESEKLLALTILEKLIRPYGVIRYPLDSYQSGNYWLKDKSIEGLPEFTGDTSSANAFKTRFGQFIPNTEAQWFFDSKLCMIYLQFAKHDKKYLRLAHLHFKRALGQITSENGTIVAADGKHVQNLAFPESINTLVREGEKTYVPSPITPLNWAKASFQMALEQMKKATNF